MAKKRQPVKPILILVAANKGWLSLQELHRLVCQSGHHLTKPQIANSLYEFIRHPDPVVLFHKRRRAGTTEYRLIHRPRHTVDKKLRQKWALELIPLLRTLIAECKKERALRDCMTISQTAFKIEAVLEQSLPKAETLLPSRQEAPGGDAGQP